MANAGAVPLYSLAGAAGELGERWTLDFAPADPVLRRPGGPPEGFVLSWAQTGDEVRLATEPWLGIACRLTLRGGALLAPALARRGVFAAGELEVAGAKTPVCVYERDVKK